MLVVDEILLEFFALGQSFCGDSISKTARLLKYEFRVLFQLASCCIWSSSKLSECRRKKILAFFSASVARITFSSSLSCRSKMNIEFNLVEFAV